MDFVGARDSVFRDSTMTHPQADVNQEQAVENNNNTDTHDVDMTDQFLDQDQQQESE